MSFPPELIDHILKSLRGDLRSLKAISLVSKAWTSWSQAYIFESIYLTPTNLPRWLKSIPPDINGPASHTRALTLAKCRLSDFPHSTLASFRGAKSLTLFQWDATLFDGASLEPYFGHFGKASRTLSFRSCKLGPATLFDLLSLLPNIQDLEIAHPSLDSGPLDPGPDVPKVTPSFRGTLSLTDIGSGHHILKAVTALPLHFTVINLRWCRFYEPETHQMLLTSCRDTLVTLRFEGDYRGRPVPDASLASCDKLEEVHAEIPANKELIRSLVTLLSSVTSRRLRKVSLSFVDFHGEAHPISKDQDLDDDEIKMWGSFDATLSRLAKQVSEVEGKLTLRLGILRWDDEPVGRFDRLLSQFSEYGKLGIDCIRIPDTFA